MGNKEISVSFDFDGSLVTYKDLRDYAKELIERDFNVWIVTARFDSVEKYNKTFCDKYGIASLIHDHNHLFKVAKSCGIKLDNIKFMNMSDKADFFATEDFLWHIDDDNYEINLINSLTNTIGVSCAPGNNQWRNKCERLIKNKLNE